MSHQMNFSWPQQEYNYKQTNGISVKLKHFEGQGKEIPIKDNVESFIQKISNNC
ncbi:10368_t:CDS:2 [Funneliformis caledonium]|uniref:10368_t:CDS:1 n=1 Tax=Funneliformis caledonium TaxID=1117310 RepID=A0A9N9CMI0_9GLOM|nr:10368_t:CDS:2 [Funneliformis caledonium]